MELKNRFIRSATWEGLANSDGSCSEELTDLMVNLAKGQVGLIISSHACVNPADIRQLGIYDERLIASYIKMLKRFTIKEVKLFCKLLMQDVVLRFN